ncbi:hypothetical protein [Streptomyces longisporoflavus]|uniref:Lipoprotein n=1 Tax=Streptomyces longisporoflavus TaxID=28044 RepID=A0ABW7QXE4_9ACTN
MRQLYVPVRWTAAAVAVMATAGCMSIGADGGGDPDPARSAGDRSAAAAPDGGGVSPGDGEAGGDDGGRADAKGGKHGKQGRKGKDKAGSDGSGGSGSDAARASASASRGGDDPAPPTRGGRPTPTQGDPGGPKPTPTPDPPKPTPTPTPEPTPEPSSSAHEPGQGPQLGDRSLEIGSREPSPEAGPA